MNEATTNSATPVPSPLFYVTLSDSVKPAMVSVMPMANTTPSTISVPSRTDVVSSVRPSYPPYGVTKVISTTYVVPVVQQSVIQDIYKASQTIVKRTLPFRIINPRFLKNQSNQSSNSNTENISFRVSEISTNFTKRTIVNNEINSRTRIQDDNSRNADGSPLAKKTCIGNERSLPPPTLVPEKSHTRDVANAEQPPRLYNR